MKPFHFRAEVVLALRRREEEAAQTTLARVRAVRDRAYAALADARESVAEAGRTFDVAVAAGAPHGTLEWHRSWIARLRLTVQTALGVVAEADQTAGRAAAALNVAMQRRRVLERLRDRAWKKYCVARDRAHIQDMDQLASLRFAGQAQDPGGPSDRQPHQRHRQPHLESDLTRGHRYPRP